MQNMLHLFWFLSKKKKKKKEHRNLFSFSNITLIWKTEQQYLILDQQ